MAEKIDKLVKLCACLVNNGDDIKVIELPHDEQQAISPIKKMDGLKVVVPPPIVPGVVLPYTDNETSPLIELTDELSRKGKNRGKSNRKNKVVSKRKRNMVKQSKRKNRKR